MNIYSVALHQTVWSSIKIDKQTIHRYYYYRFGNPTSNCLAIFWAKTIINIDFLFHILNEFSFSFIVILYYFFTFLPLHFTLSFSHSRFNTATIGIDIWTINDWVPWLLFCFHFFSFFKLFCSILPTHYTFYFCCVLTPPNSWCHTNLLWFIVLKNLAGMCGEDKEEKMKR